MAIKKIRWGVTEAGGIRGKFLNRLQPLTRLLMNLNPNTLFPSGSVTGEVEMGTPESTDQPHLFGERK